jgi:hypothetical protein
MKKRMLKQVLCLLAMLVGIGMAACPAANAEFEVYDADNQYLGILGRDIQDVYYGATVPVFVPAINRVITILPDGSIQDDRVFKIHTIFYEFPDCSGTPYMGQYTENNNNGLSSNLFNYPNQYYAKTYEVPRNSR